MKKIYRKGTVHPTPSAVSEHLLSFLPAAIMVLTAALSPADREVLAYLISCSPPSFSSVNGKGRQKASVAASRGGDHLPCFNCNCFRCYMSYWVKWDSSPNRQLIHEIIDAFEESLLKGSRKETNKRERRKGKNVKVNVSDATLMAELNSPETVKAEVNFNLGGPSTAVDGTIGEAVAGEDRVVELKEEIDKGSVRRFVSFLGERIWSVWG